MHLSPDPVKEPIPISVPIALDEGTVPGTIQKVQKSWSVGTLTYTAGSLLLLFSWLLWGDFAWNLKERAIMPIAQIMLKSLHSTDTLVGLLMGSLPAGLAMLIGPWISVKSDRHRGRWGRRIPFLLVPIPFVVVSMLGLGMSPSIGIWLDGLLGPFSPGGSAAGLAAFVVFWTLFEVSSIIANTVFGGLINDVVPAVLIGRFFALFRAINLLAAIIFSYWIIEYVKTYSLLILAGLAAVYGVGFGLMCLKIKEGSYPAVERLAPGPKGVIVTEIRTYIHECFNHKYYRWLFAAATLALLSKKPGSSPSSGMPSFRTPLRSQAAKSQTQPRTKQRPPQLTATGTRQAWTPLMKQSCTGWKRPPSGPLSPTEVPVIAICSWNTAPSCSISRCASASTRCTPGWRRSNCPAL